MQSNHSGPPDERPDSRHELLVSARALLAHAPVADLIGTAGSVRSVTTAAGVTNGAFYHWWPDREAFLVDLARTAFEPRWLDDLLDRLDLPEGAPDDPVGMAAGAAAAGFEELGADDWHAIRLLLAATRPHPEIEAAAAAFLDEMFDRIAVLIEVVLRPAGRLPREPVTPRSFAAVITAIGLGLDLVGRIGPPDTPRELFPHVLAAVLPSLTRTEGDDRTLTERTRDLTVSPATRPPATEPALSSQQRGARTKQHRSRSIILESASELLRASHEDATVRAVAEHAGVAEATVYKLFGSRVSLAGSVFAGRLRARLSSGALTSGTTVERLHDVLGETTREALGTPRLAHSWMSTIQAFELDELPADFDREALVTPIYTVAQVLRSGADRKELRDDVDVFAAAYMLVLGVVTRAVMAPTSVDTIVAPTMDLVLNGMGADGRLRIS